METTLAPPLSARGSLAKTPAGCSSSSSSCYRPRAPPSSLIWHASKSKLGALSFDSGAVTQARRPRGEILRLPDVQGARASGALAEDLLHTALGDSAEFAAPQRHWLQERRPSEGAHDAPTFGMPASPEPSAAFVDKLAAARQLPACSEGLKALTPRPMMGTDARLRRLQPFGEAPTPSLGSSAAVPSGTPGGGGDVGSGAKIRMLACLSDIVQWDVDWHTARTDDLRDTTSTLRRQLGEWRHSMRSHLVAKIPMFSKEVLSHEEQVGLAGLFTPLAVRRGENIIVEGEVGHELYVIEHGFCNALKKVGDAEVVVGRLGAGAFFGEIGLLYDVPRTATVRADGEVTVLVLKRKELWSAMGTDKLESMRVLAHTQVFNNIALLSRFTAGQKIRIAQRLKREKWLRGNTLALERSLTTRLIIIESGDVCLQVANPDALPHFMRPASGDGFVLGAGSFLGMRGLLHGAPMGFKVTAVSDELYTLSITCDEILGCGDSPEEQRKMMSTMMDAMRSYLLRQIPQLKRLPERTFQRLQKHAEQVTYEAHQPVFCKGGVLDALYVLQSGTLVEHAGSLEDLAELGDSEVSSPEHFTPGLCWGQESLTQTRPRAETTLVAVSDCCLLRVLPAPIWDALMEERAHLAQVRFLSSEVLSKDEQLLLVSRLQPWSFPAGHKVMVQGDLGDRLYIVEFGTCEVVALQGGEERVVHRLDRGSVFGELGVLFDSPRGATVRARSEVELVSLSREDLTSSVSSEKLQRMREIADPHRARLMQAAGP